MKFEVDSGRKPWFTVDVMEMPSEEQTYAILGAAMEVYHQLGCGFLEAVYQEALELELHARGIPYEREKVLTISYRGKTLKQTYQADFVCYGSVIVELKAVSRLENVHRAQVLNYLKATEMRVGLLLNFGAHHGLEKERKVL